MKPFRETNDRDCIIHERQLGYTDFFPFNTYRKDQEKIIKEVEENTRKNKNILLEAPNGSGKTIIALSGILPVAYERGLKILYLNRTHAQNTRVIKEIKKITTFLETKKGGLKISAVSLRGRNEMCSNENLKNQKPNSEDAMTICESLRKNQACIQFGNFLLNIEGGYSASAIIPKFDNTPVDAEEILLACKTRDLCPYYFSKLLLQEANIIICNYNWIFNPFIRPFLLRDIGATLNQCILVIDECHNILEVATNLNSDRISLFSLKTCLKDLTVYKQPKIYRDMVKSLVSHLRSKKLRLTHVEQIKNPRVILERFLWKLNVKSLGKLKREFMNLLEIGEKIQEQKEEKMIFTKNFVSSLAKFWLKWMECYQSDAYFFCYNIKKGEDKEKKTIQLEINALDPREVTIPVLGNIYSSVGLSGTIIPDVYQNLIGLKECEKDSHIMYMDSPFLSKNYRALITEGVDTARDDRTEEMYKNFIIKIDEVLQVTPKNVGIFCASYTVLNGLLKNGIEDVVIKHNKKLFKEQSGLTASENAQLLEDFKSMANSYNSGGVLLGVCSGRNSEGEDYPGDYMNAVIIAGFPYKYPSSKNKAKIKYFNRVFNNRGWDYAYLYPAILAANQASGRPIRRLDDKGVIVFMDSRFKTKVGWISSWVRKQLVAVSDQPNAIYNYLKNFWE